jgi:hypothetical protein
MPIFAPIISVIPIASTRENSILDKMLSIIEHLFVTSGAAELITCENSAHTKGWKLDWSSPPNKDVKAGSIDIGLRYPSIGWAPCGCYETLDWPALSLGLSTSFVVARKLRIRAIKKIAPYLNERFRNPILSLKSNWLKYRNWGVKNWDKFVKLPPVPSGHKRLYRLNGSVPVTASDNNGWGTGRWFTDSQEYAMRHSQFAVGETHISYIDIPIDIADNSHMGNPNSKWRKILAESGEKMNGGQGADAGRLIDNPARFVGGEAVAKNEYFLDSDYANQAIKVSQFSSLPDIKELNDAWKPMEKMFDTWDSEKFLDNIEYRNKFVNEWNQNVSSLKSKLSKYFDDSDFVFKWLMQGDEFYQPIQANLPDGSYYRPPPAGLENLFNENSLISRTVLAATSLFVFINQLISVTDVVRDKNCSPIGQRSSYGPTIKDKEFIQKIRNTAIAKKQVTWAELNPETCECNECPEDWNFCDNSSITNLYTAYGNTCHPPCCGGQEWKPITLLETCKCGCPDGKVFMECDCSDCSEGSGTPILDLITRDKRKKGKCVDKNPDPSKLEWNKKTCKWECKTLKNIYPPHLWGGTIKVPIDPPCKPNQQRKPNACECSGSYSLDPCVSETLNTLGIQTLSQIELI